MGRLQASANTLAQGKVHARRCRTRSSCYTDFVLKNMTITVSEEAARWARRKAAEENTSVSKLVGRMLEDQMRRNDDYWKAYEEWKKIKPIPGLDAAKRMSRQELYDTARQPVVRRHQRPAV
jgi:hypothetical protein